MSDAELATHTHTCPRCWRSWACALPGPNIPGLCIACELKVRR